MSDAYIPPSATQHVTRPHAVRRLRRLRTYYIAALLVFTLLAVCAYLYPYFSFDLAATRRIQSFDSPLVLSFMRALSVFGNGITPHVLTALIVILFLAMRRRSEAAGLLLATGGSALLNTLLKHIIHRPRPDALLVHIFAQPDTLSFPSGHVTFYVCFFGFLFFSAYALLPRASLQRRAALALLPLPILLVGISRIYLGAHWLSDTLGAYLWSGVWLGFSLQMYRRWKRRATFHSAEEIRGENIEGKSALTAAQR